MARKQTKKNSYPKPSRLSFPEAESAFDWLPMILDAYYVTDVCVHEGVEKELKKHKGSILACSKGCSSCCKTHVTIPVYPLELYGLYWYLSDIAEAGLKERIIGQLSIFEPGKGCPFLIDGACGVHPMRPMACRFFNVFNAVCRDGEDPYYTRRHDVLTPEEKAKGKALSMLLPHHGIIQRTEKKEAIRSGYMNRLVKNLQEIRWPNIAERLANGDRSPLISMRME